MNLSFTGEGKVLLLAGGGKCYTDIAARFVTSEHTLDEIIASPYDKNLIDKILSGGHLSATEFDYYIFGIEGYARVTEIELVRKRIASYLIKTGRANKNGRRSFDMVLPEAIINHKINFPLDDIELNLISDTGQNFICKNTPNLYYNSISEGIVRINKIEVILKPIDILYMIESWYNTGVELNFKEEDLRYLKPQALEFKAIIGMNAHALLDWFGLRCCNCAQYEIRNLANKMLKLCKNTTPDLFKTAGAHCVKLGYCPENEFQNEKCKGKVRTHEEVLKILKALPIS